MVLDVRGSELPNKFAFLGICDVDKEYLLLKREINNSDLLLGELPTI